MRRRHVALSARFRDHLISDLATAMGRKRSDAALFYARVGASLAPIAGGLSMGGSAFRRKDRFQQGASIDANRLTELHIIDDADLPFAPFELGNMRLIDAEGFGQFDLGKTGRLPTLGESVNQCPIIF
jgi:hypothetical protein